MAVIPSPAGSAATAARLIALDWGTSNLRASLLGDGGRTLETRAAAGGGVMAVPERRFEAALMSLAGDWIEAHRCPLIASGMIGAFLRGWGRGWWAGFAVPPCRQPARPDPGGGGGGGWRGAGTSSRTRRRAAGLLVPGGRRGLDPAQGPEKARRGDNEPAAVAFEVEQIPATRMLARARARSSSATSSSPIQRERRSFPYDTRGRPPARR